MQYMPLIYLDENALSEREREQCYKDSTQFAHHLEASGQLGGFFLVNAKDLDQAIDIAARIPAGRWGTVEIRPLVEIPDLPENSFSRSVEFAAPRSTQG